MPSKQTLPLSPLTMIFLSFPCFHETEEKEKIRRRVLAKSIGPSTAAVLLPYSCTNEGCCLRNLTCRFLGRPGTVCREKAYKWVSTPPLSTATRILYPLIYSIYQFGLTIPAKFLPASSCICPRSLLIGMCPSLNL